MSERCEQSSEWTSERPCTYVPILALSEPLRQAIWKWMEQDWRFGDSKSESENERKTRKHENVMKIDDQEKQGFD